MDLLQQRHPLQYSCLENPMDARAWKAAVHRVAEGLDTTERLHFHFSLSCTGEGNGNPLQCSCLENPRDERAWWAAIYGVTQSQIRLKWHSSSSSSSSSCWVPELKSSENTYSEKGKGFATTTESGKYGSPMFPSCDFWVRSLPHTLHCCVFSPG